MEDLLYLAHRIPFPPNKGDKIRSYHLLKALCRHYRVHLGSFVDDPDDWPHQATLAPLCASICLLPLKRSLAYAKGLTALMNGQPITVPFYRARQMQRWVDQTLQQQSISRALVFSSSMAQYLEPHSSLKRVIDFVDVDSDKWAQYADRKRGLSRWVYRREHSRLRHYENHIAETFDHSLFVSAEEAELFRNQLTRGAAGKVSFMPNGVDTEYFDPMGHHHPENLGSGRFICFTGAMDYWANEDAVTWFCEHVWPSLRQGHPDLRFVIVGGNPSSRVKQLTSLPGVEVTGRVEDVRPFLHRAELVVAPLRIARGIQNKVLEAMAMAKPIVATSMAMEGIPLTTDLVISVNDQAEAFADACDSLLSGRVGGDPTGNRRWVQQQFSWHKTLGELPRFLEESKP